MHIWQTEDLVCMDAVLWFVLYQQSPVLLISLRYALIKALIRLPASALEPCLDSSSSPVYLTHWNVSMYWPAIFVCIEVYHLAYAHYCGALYSMLWFCSVDMRHREEIEEDIHCTHSSCYASFDIKNVLDLGYRSK